MSAATAALTEIAVASATAGGRGAGRGLAEEIKATRATHTAQRDKLAFKSQEECTLIEDMRTYLKRRSEIEWQYCEEQSKLCAQFLQQNRRFSVAGQKPLAAAAAKPGDSQDDRRLLLKAWTTLLEETKSYAKMRGTYAERLRESFTTPMKPYVEEKRRLFTKHNDHLAQKVQADLHTTFTELDKAKTVYQDCAREAEKAQQRYDDALKAPTGTLNRLFSFKVTKEKLDQARLKLKSATHKAQEARNNYILKLEALNNHQATYHATALPQVMRSMDSYYYDAMRNYLTEYSDIETQNFKEAIASMAKIKQAAGRIDRELENKDFLQENAQVFSSPKPVALELYPGDKTVSIEVDEISKVVLSNVLNTLLTRRAKLDDAIAKKDKELEAVRRISKAYDATPSFGRATDTQDSEDTLILDRDCYVCEQMRIDAQVKLLRNAGVEVLNPPAAAVKKIKKESSMATMPIGFGTCTALYDYTPQKPDEIAFRQGDVITIIEDGPDWIKGSLNGREGYLPATYITKTATSRNGGDSMSSSHGLARAQALYDFTGNEDDQELSFHAGDIIEIIARGTEDDANFWEGRINGKTGFFPALFVSDLESDEDSLASETSTIDGRRDRMESSAAEDGPALMASRSLNSSSGNLASALTAPSARPVAPVPVVPPAARPVAPVRKHFVVAVYDYEAQVEGELSFEAGERIDVISTDIGSDDWWEGRNERGEVGQFPKAYVAEETKPASPPTTLRRNNTVQRNKETVVAQYQYDAGDTDELSIRPGDVIELTAADLPDDPQREWYEGRVNGRQGRFPRSYVRRA